MQVYKNIKHEIRRKTISKINDKKVEKQTENMGLNKHFNHFRLRFGAINNYIYRNLLLLDYQKRYPKVSQLPDYETAMNCLNTH